METRNDIGIYEHIPFRPTPPVMLCTKAFTIFLLPPIIQLPCIRDNLFQKSNWIKIQQILVYFNGKASA